MREKPAPLSERVTHLLKTTAARGLEAYQRATIARILGRTFNRLPYRLHRSGSVDAHGFLVPPHLKPFVRGLRPDPHRLMIMGVDLGREASVGVVGIKDEAGRFHVQEVEPIDFVDVRAQVRAQIADAFAVPRHLIMNPPPGSSAARLAAIHDLMRETERHAEEAMRYGLRTWVQTVERHGLSELRFTLDTSRFTASMLLAGNAVARLRHKTDLMKLENLERRWPGAGRRTIEARCFEAYHHRRHSWRAGWIRASAAYAEACALHLELTGRPYVAERHDPCEAPF